MVLPAMLPKTPPHWLLTLLHLATEKVVAQAFHKQDASKAHDQVLSHCKCSGAEGASGATVVCGFHGALLRCTSFFPYFMLVAFEGGGLLRALLLLCAYPVVWALGEHGDAGIRVMVFVAFAGLTPRDVQLVARAVLPNFYMEGVSAQVYDVWARARRKVVVTSAPTAMVEWFLKEYMGADEVVGCELQAVRLGGRRYFTGLLSGLGKRQKALKQALGGDATAADAGIVSHCHPLDHLLIPYCKEAYVVGNESATHATLPRDKYPKPLIFHDSRLAFLPTPAATLAFLLFLPLGTILAVIRISIGIVLPYNLAFATGAIFGVRFRVSGLRQPTDAARPGGVLYVCTHRTLVDPIMLTAALQKPVPAVTYSLSRLSEIIAPIKTVRLTRDRAKDAETMSRLLEQGDLAVCPEGTTCREPYLLRFSPLFADLADDMEPVALDARVTWLHGTTASGRKWLDPVAFFANPAPAYRVEFLGRVPREWTRAGGRSSAEVANWVQRRLGEALGFECTGLTRRDKYMMLAGNDGVVAK